ncbi:MAG: alpha/beta hydrolase, partial [Planctomycetaceae bacterium]|nr:alpha/beta hydrolase [Planctomycetaceae bacterium]
MDLSSVNPVMVATLAGALLTALCVCGCRGSAPPVLKKPTIAVHYDTEYEHTIVNNEHKPAMLEGIWDQYVETLDEPVSVTEWNETASQWRVLFATNRGAVSATSAGFDPEGGFGNQVTASVSHGTATVQLPHRHRGQDPAQKPRFKLASLTGQDPEEEQPLASVIDVAKLPAEDFRRQLRQQIDASRQHDVLLFVHGFNVDFESSLIRAAQLGLDIPFNGALVAYSWPTQGGVLNYSDDEPINTASVQPFVQFLREVVDTLPEDARL